MLSERDRTARKLGMHGPQKTEVICAPFALCVVEVQVYSRPSSLQWDLCHWSA
jgi:hypothetical protein